MTHSVSPPKNAVKPRDLTNPDNVFSEIHTSETAPIPQKAGITTQTATAQNDALPSEYAVKAYLDKCYSLSLSLNEVVRRLLINFSSISDSNALEMLNKYFNSRCKPPRKLIDIKRAIESERADIEAEQDYTAALSKATPQPAPTEAICQAAQIAKITPLESKKMQHVEPQEQKAFMKLFEPEPVTIGDKVAYLTLEPVEQQTGLLFIKHVPLFFQSTDTVHLSNSEYGLLWKLFELCGQRLVIPSDNRTLSKLTGTESAEFEKLFPSIERFFVHSDSDDLMVSPLILENVKELKRNSIKGTLAVKHRHQPN